MYKQQVYALKGKEKDGEEEEEEHASFFSLCVCGNEEKVQLTGW